MHHFAERAFGQAGTFPLPTRTNRHAWEARQVLNWTAALLACLWLALIANTLDPHVDDFRQYWQAGVNVWASGDPYATTPGPGASEAALAQPTAFPNPPLLAYLVAPLSALPYPAARMVWLAGNSALLAALAWLSLAASGAVRAHQWWGVVFFITAVAPPTRLSLQLGQVSLLLAVLLLGALVLGSPSKRPWQHWLAGVLLALATLIKLYPGLIALYFLLRGPRRVAYSCAVAGGALFGLSLLAHGLTPYSTYLERVVLGGFYLYEAEFNLSLMGFWERLFSISRYSLPLLHQPALAHLLTALCSGLVLAICMQALRSRGAGGSDGPVAALWLCAMLLLSPVNGYYNLVLLLFPALVVSAEVERRTNRTLLVGVALAGLLCAVPPAWAGGIPALHAAVRTGWGLFMLQPAFYGLLLLAVLLYRAGRAGVPYAPGVSSVPATCSGRRIQIIEATSSSDAPSTRLKASSYSLAGDL
jgi:hypothetical protein